MSTNLSLPYLSPGQAQKHVTVNESLRRLDAIVQMSAASAATAAQPAAPDDGTVYILPAGKSGEAWSSMADGALAYYRDGAWEEIAPREGWLVFVRDANLLLHYTGAAWSRFAPASVLTVSAADRLVGRASSGAGPAEEIALTAAGRALIDDADSAAQRATLAAAGTGVANTFTAMQTVSAGASPAVDLRSTNSGAAAASGSSLANVVSRIANSNGVALDIGYNAGAFWVQGRSSSDYGSVTWLDLCPTGGQITRAGAALFDGAQHNAPQLDNFFNLGSASYRFATVYAGTGAINTSDAREKTALRGLNEAERRAIRRVLAGVGVFQLRASVEAKGDAARLHVGVSAQAVAEAFATEGLDAARYGLWCADPLVERRILAPEAEGGAPAIIETPALDAAGRPRTRLGVRYDQLLAMALAALAQTA